MSVADFGRNLPERREVVDALADLPEPSSNIPESEFHAMVERAKEYILAGDIFQVVLSQRFQLPFTLPPFSLYRALRRLNPSPFLFFLDLGRFRHRGLQPGDPGAAARREGDHPPHRRHAPARRHAGGGSASWRPSCSPIPRNGPSI